MKRRILGNTDLKVSELCLGTMNFGWKIDEASSLSILDAYRASGGNFIQALCVFPTADNALLSNCASLSLIGRWWRAGGLRRQDLVLSTRLSWPRSAEPGVSNATALVGQRCDEVLRQLHTDHLDVLVCDWNENLLLNGEFRHALDNLVRDGKVRYLALANPRSWQATDLLHLNYRQGHVRIAALQADYSLVARVGIETEFMDLCADKRLGLLVSSPLAGGLLTRRDSLPPLIRLRVDRLATKFGESAPRAVSAALADLAEEKGATHAQVALAWVLHNPQVTSVIVGGTSPRHFAELSEAPKVRLTRSDLLRLGFASQNQHVSLPAIRQVAADGRKPDAVAANPRQSAVA